MAVKLVIMNYERKRAMAILIREAFINTAFRGRPTAGEVNLRIRRTHLVEDSLHQVRRFI